MPALPSFGIPELQSVPGKLAEEWWACPRHVRAALQAVAVACPSQLGMNGHGTALMQWFVPECLVCNARPP
eukprot:scaffold1481_cov401-Prasinococcus_capsulatus_cf.AAC.5